MGRFSKTIMNYYNPQIGIIANQDEGGVPFDKSTDRALRSHNPVATANAPFVPDTVDAHGGLMQNHTPPLLPFAQNGYLYVWNYNQNYQGDAPMDLQPQIDMPKPWEMI